MLGWFRRTGRRRPSRSRGGLTQGSPLARSAASPALPVLVSALLFCAGASARAQDVAPGPSAEEAPETPSTIALTPEPGQDMAITERLEAIYAAMSGLDEVNVSTEAGVVTLVGSVEAPRLRATSEDIARAVEGVVAVENELVSATAVQPRVRGVMAELQERAAGWLRSLPLWLIAIALVAAAWFVGAWLGTVAVRGLAGARNPFAGQLVRQAVRLVVTLAGVLLALLLLDAGPAIAPVIGGVGLLGLALGFAVRDTLENYLASVLLSLRQPFRPNDFVSVDGREGTVLRLTSRATLLMDLDGNHVRIPNALVYKATIVNYERNPFRRFSFRAGVDPGAQLTRVLRIAESALAETPGVLADPPPLAVVDAFAEWATTITCHAWIDQRDVDLIKTRSAAMVAVQRAFARERVDMPIPSYAVTLQRPDGAAAPEAETAAAPDPEQLDVSRADPTRPFRERDEGQNLLAGDGRTE